MTYPITPNPAIHNIPAAIVKQNRIMTSQALETLGQQLIQGVLNALLALIFGGSATSLGTAAPGTTSQSAPGILQSWLQGLFGQASTSSMHLSMMQGKVQGNTIADWLQWIEALFGIPSAATTNGDGTATALGTSAITINSDGTASLPIAAVGSGTINNLLDHGDGTTTSIWAWLTNLGSQFGTHQALKNAIVQGASGNTPGHPQTNTDVQGALAALFGNTSNGQTAYTNWTTVLNGLGLGSISQYVLSLFGLTPPALDNSDGTAATAATANITIHTDGTATTPTQLGASPINGLTDNGDGTAMSFAHWLQNIASAFGINQQLINTLFGGNGTASTIQSHLLPNITAGTGNGQSSDLQSVADQVHQVVNGGSGTGTPITGIKTNLGQFPMANIVVDTVTATTVTQDATGSAATAFPINNSLIMTVPNGDASPITIGSTANYLVATAAVFYDIGSTVTLANAILDNGFGVGTQLDLLGSLQSPSSDGTLYFFGMANPPTGVQNVGCQVRLLSSQKIYMAAMQTSSYIGVSSVGVAQTRSGSGSAPTASSILSGNSHMCVQAFAAYGLGQDVTMSNYSQTQRLNSSLSGSGFNLGLLLGDAPGNATLTFRADVPATNSNECWTAIAVDFIPAQASVIGSGMRVPNTSVTTRPLTSGTHAITTAGPYYDASPTYITPDLAWDSTNQFVTVTLAGWYLVEFSLFEPAVVTSHGYHCVLYHNGVPEQAGGNVNVTTTSANQYVAHGSFSTYCAGNDTLGAGFYSTVSVAGALTGEATGVWAQFSVCLLNRSQNG